MTRLKPERQAIIRKLQANQRIEDAAQEYWYKRRGAGRGAVSLVAPNQNADQWEAEEMVSAGLAWRGGRADAAAGHGIDVYKGENILAGELFGEPEHRNADISKADDLGMFKLGKILPRRIYAVAQIERCPNAVAFDPTEAAFTNTATLFAPRRDLQDVPFDILLVSRVYRYFYALAGRMSYLNLMRSHIYSGNFRLLPWNEELAFVAQPLEALREPLTDACANAFQTEAKLFVDLAALPLTPFRDAMRAVGGKVEWSESFRGAAEKIELGQAPTCLKGDEGWKLTLNDYLYDWLIVSDEAAARGLFAAIKVRLGETVDMNGLLDLPIPSDAATRADHDALVALYRTADHQAAIEAQVDRIDALVGPALGLDAEDLAAIRHDMLTDPFLKNIVPRWPGSSTRLHGYRTGLDSAERYSR